MAQQQPTGQNQPRADKLARTHHAHTTIRAQTAKQKQKQDGAGGGAGGGGGGAAKQGQTKQQQGKGKGKGQASEEGSNGSKEVSKAVLANPLVPQWPEISPSHQSLILSHLLESLPGIQEFHISRDRCNRNSKKKAQKVKRERARKEGGLPGRGGKKNGEEGGNDVLEAQGKENEEAGDEDMDEEASDLPASGSSPSQIEIDAPPRAPKRKADEIDDPDDNRPSKKPRPESISTTPGSSHTNLENAPRTTKQAIQQPEILNHMVIGINEVMKQMEKQMVAFKGEFYAGQKLGEGRESLEKEADREISEAAEGEESAYEAEEQDGFTDNENEQEDNLVISNGISKHKVNKSYIRIIFVCPSDINPRHLVDPIPQYCTSWNALISQSRSKLQKIIRGRTKEELKGRKDVDGMVNAVKGAMEVLLVTLPKGAEYQLANVMGLRRVAVVALTKTFPGLSEFLQVLMKSNLQPLQPPFPLDPSSSSTTLPCTPLHLKSISTTVPVDLKGKKAVRLTETREKRKAATQKRKETTEMWKKKGERVYKGVVLKEGRQVSGRPNGAFVKAAGQQKEKEKEKDAVGSRQKEKKSKQSNLIPTAPLQ